MSLGYVRKKLLRKHVLRPVVVVRGHKYVLRSKGPRRTAVSAKESLAGRCGAGARFPRIRDVPVKRRLAASLKDSICEEALQALRRMLANGRLFAEDVFRSRIGVTKKALPPGGESRQRLRPRW